MGSCTAILFLLIVNLGNVASNKKNTKIFLLEEAVQQCNLSDMVLCSEDTKNDIKTYYNTNDSNVNATILEYPSKYSPCPWRYVKVFNGNRIPNTTIQAVCESKKCRSPSNACAKANTKKQLTKISVTTSKCQPIRYYRWVKVLNETRSMEHKSKKNHYDDRLLPITIGCTCTHARKKKPPTVPK